MTWALTVLQTLVRLPKHLLLPVEVFPGGHLWPVLGDSEFRLISSACCPEKPQALEMLSSLNLWINPYSKWLLTGQLHSLKSEVFLFVLSSVLEKLGLSYNRIAYYLVEMVGQVASHSL